jgi:hypothetical protein
MTKPARKTTKPNHRGRTATASPIGEMVVEVKCDTTELTNELSAASERVKEFQRQLDDLAARIMHGPRPAAGRS